MHLHTGRSTVLRWRRRCQLLSKPYSSKVAPLASKSSNAGKAALLACTVGGAALYSVSTEKEREQALRLAHSAFRIANLVSTATVMAADYGWNLWYYKHIFNKQNIADVDHMYASLRQLQADQETVTVKSMQLKAQHNELLKLDKRSAEEQAALESAETMLAVYNQQLADIIANITRTAESIAAEQGEGPVKHHRAQYLHAIHRRNARRLRDMCARNGGLYIKLGQHLAMLDHVIPKEYQEFLITLLSNTPTSTMESVRRVFEEEFGQTPEQLFDRFDPVPIASASLAQVHVAVKNGRKLAVKVQHEGLSEGSEIDRLVITLIVDMLTQLFPAFRYKWLAKEMNTNTPIELDFRCERENLRTATEHLRPFIEKGDVAVPSAVDELSSRRVLTMSFEEGVYVSRMHDNKQCNFRASDVSTLISRVFCEQIFRSGFVHCDPHEANLLVRSHPKHANKPQLVLLDHGLYRKLSEDFRRDYARLWQAILLADEPKIEHFCKRLQAGNLYPVLASVLTMKSWNNILSSESIDELQGRGTGAELVVLQNYAMRYFEEIIELLDVVPSDLLLLLKTNDCLRHLDRMLQTPINSTSVVAEVSSRVVLEEDLADVFTDKEASMLTSVGRCYHAIMNYTNVQSRMTAMSLAGSALSWLTESLNWWNGQWGGPSTAQVAVGDEHRR